MSSVNDYSHALHSARAALRRGDNEAAMQWGKKAVTLNPQKEYPWLILAAVAHPKESIEYLNRALQINPQSQRARKGMEWAVKRYRASVTEKSHGSIQLPISRNPEAFTSKRQVLFPWVIIIVLLSLGFLTMFFTLEMIPIKNLELPIAFAQILSNETDTPTPTTTNTALPTNTSTPTLSPTNTTTFTPTITSTFTEAPSLTPSLTSTLTPTPTETETAIPTETIADTLTPSPGPNGNFSFPEVEAGEHWIDIDLSQQRAYAYEGYNLVREFVVSTGRRGTPTVQGQYKIYVKYRKANMSGPGYFLPNVPYVMYFYKGYGLHGTYWHNNFGHPMSHGCVNFTIDDAKWVYNFVSVGSKVNVHR